MLTCDLVWPHGRRHRNALWRPLAVSALFTLLLASPCAARPGAQGVTPPPAPQRANLCVGRYASSLSNVRRDARAMEQQTRWTFCVRSSAVYQCLAYGPDGEVRRSRKAVRSHGTAFAFRRDRSRTWLMTNEHVSDWPLVSGADDVDGVPAGCKRISASLHVVDNEEDSYDKDDIALHHVVSDAERDVAIVRAPFRVAAIPFDVGHSGGLETGASVHVRGYPLGAFQAVTVGKIINPRHRDTEQGWDHTDFVIDAPVSEGSSGSPVLAVNCRTGRYELIGVFHAAYKQGQSLNVVVGIDQVVEMMRTLKAPARQGHRSHPTAAERADLLKRLAAGEEPLMPFANAFVRVSARGGELHFTLHGKRYPLDPTPLATLVDGLQAGRAGPVRLMTRRGPLAVAQLGPRSQRRVRRLWRLLRARAREVGRHRRLSKRATRSRAAHMARQRVAERMAAQESEERAAVAELVALLRRAR